MTLNLTATTTEEKVLKEYLEQNASEMLADKINNGVSVEKDGKKLVSRKTLAGFMKYATDEARKQAAKGTTSACLHSDIVFGWAIHYFEEDSIPGTLYNEDGTEYKIPKQGIGNDVDLALSGDRNADLILQLIQINDVESDVALAVVILEFLHVETIFHVLNLHFNLQICTRCCN